MQVFTFPLNVHVPISFPLPPSFRELVLNKLVLQHKWQNFGPQDSRQSPLGLAMPPYLHG